MKKNKLILFDWGNIVESHLTGYTCHDAWNDTMKECGFNIEENVYPYLVKYRLSSLKNEEEFRNIYDDMKKDMNLNKTYEEFVKIYYKYFDRIDFYKDVADYEKSLGDKCYIGIFSNLCIFDKERLDRQVDLSKYDYAFLSFELGYRKPDQEIYELVQGKVPFNKEDILFIDDREDNIMAASKYGWNTFQTTGLELDKIKEVCEKFIK